MPIVAAAAIGAGATLFASSTAADASKSAADATAQANQAAIAEQQREYDTARADQAPWRAVGASALGQLAGEYGITVPGATTTPSTYDTYLKANPDLAAYIQTDAGKADVAAKGGLGAFLQKHDMEFANEGRGSYTDTSFQASPDYQSRFTEGERAVTGNNAAKGLLDSGALGAGLIKYGQGEATQGYNDWFSHLSTLAGYGQQANVATQAAGTNAANNTSSLLQNTGAARSTSIQQQGQTTAGLISGLGGIASGLVTNLSNPSAGTGIINTTPQTVNTTPYAPAGGLITTPSTIPTGSVTSQTPELYGSII